MNLVLVESPTKSKSIEKFLGPGYKVMASYGHIRDLPKGDLGIDTENDFEPKYVIPTKARKNLTALKKEAAKADTIILATDPDREGEAIAWHLTQALGLGNKIKSKKPTADKQVQRVVFHEITKKAIEEAVQHPRDIDNKLVDAQQARRVLDRLVGYKLSPFLWKKVARGLSAGRVQSVAVRLIVEREREIEAFKPEEYWSITAILETADKINFPANLVKVGEKTLDKLDIKNEADAKKILAKLGNAEYKVENIDKKETNRSPYPPFTTSTLQQDAARKLRFSSKQTMMLAQQLYEDGKITYMRTDSVNLSGESIAAAKEFISKSFGEKYSHARQYKTKSKNAQEAHEAVRPTDPTVTPESLQATLSPQQFKIYNLIWQRFMASQMAPAVFDTTSIDIAAAGHTFRANGTTMKFDGFLKVYPTTFEEVNLPILKVNEILKLLELKPEQHFTKPPARYNEASLIKILEKEGIGRPSTYAPTISTILARNYVEKDRSRYFHPTEIGMMVNDVLVTHFPNIVDVKFTSHFEDELDDIALGKLKWVPVIREFFEPFEQLLKEKYEEVSKAEVTQQEETGEICQLCGSKMVKKMGRYGHFIACSNFPTCKNILKEPKPKPEKTGEVCDKCREGEIVIRVGRFGKFKACSRYPKCKNTKKIPKDPKEENPPKE